MTPEDWAEWKQKMTPEDWAEWKKKMSPEEMNKWQKWAWAEWKKKMTPESWAEMKEKMTPHDWEVYKQKIEDTWGEWKGKDWDFEKPEIDEWHQQGMKHVKNHIKNFAKQGKKFTRETKHWVKKQVNKYVGEDEHKKAHPKKIWLDTHRDEDSAPAYMQQDAPEEPECPIQRIKQRINAFIAEH
jgi:hypothetical protein